MELQYRTRRDGELVKPASIDERRGIAHFLVEGRAEVLPSTDENVGKVRICMMPFGQTYEPEGAEWTESFHRDAFDEWFAAVERGDEHIDILAGHERKSLNTSMVGSTRSKGLMKARAFLDKTGTITGRSGAYIDVDFWMDDPSGLSKRTYNLVADGVLPSGSVGFYGEKEAETQNGDRVHIEVQKTRIYEVSLVDRPAYRSADAKPLVGRGEQMETTTSETAATEVKGEEAAVETKTEFATVLEKLEAVEAKVDRLSEPKPAEETTSEGSTEQEDPGERGFADFLGSETDS